MGRWHSFGLSSGAVTIALLVWLLVKAVDAQKWTEHAASPSPGGKGTG